MHSPDFAPPITMKRQSSDGAVLDAHQSQVNVTALLRVLCLMIIHNHFMTIMQFTRVNESFLGGIF